MKLDTALYARLLREAADNPRLRQATDLRTSPADQSQRMLTVEETKAKIAALEYIQKELTGEGNFVQ